MQKRSFDWSCISSLKLNNSCINIKYIKIQLAFLNDFFY
jgi:hypothetical protein